METNYCKKYPTSEVLPDENDNCSLCGSYIDSLGGCTGSSASDYLEKFEEERLTEMLSYYYEVDRDNCMMSQKDFIKELAKALTDKDYLEKFKAEYVDYKKTMNE